MVGYSDGRYCDTKGTNEKVLTSHPTAGHEQEDMSGIDQPQVVHTNLRSASSVRQAIGERRISRRATIAAAAIGMAGIGGLGFSVLGSSHATEIHSWEDLHNVRNDLGADYILMTNLDADSPGYDDFAGPGADGGAGWEPIRTFTGNFDGDGYTIGDLVIDRGQNDVGLFGETSSTSTITDLILSDPDVTGGRDVGAIVGAHNGTVTDSFVLGGSVTSATTSTDGHIGGFVGVLYAGEILRSGTSATVFAEDAGEVGGFGGDMAGSAGVEQGYALGDVTADTRVGGLFGDANGGSDIINCYATGAVTGDSAVGGLLGREEGGEVDIVDSYWDEGTTGQSDGIGDPYSGDKGTPLSTDEMTGEDAAVNMIGFDFDDTWHLVVDGQGINPIPRADGYPVLQGVDVGTQLDAQGVEWDNPSILRIDSGGDVTISNVTVDGGDE